MTCPSCGYPLPDRHADSCGYCEAYPEVRRLGLETTCAQCGHSGHRGLCAVTGCPCGLSRTGFYQWKKDRGW